MRIYKGCQILYAYFPMNTRISKISLIIPVYNESENLQALHAEIARALAGVEEPWEILLVDDGSSDDSLGIIQSLAEADSRVRFVSFARNCGQSAAFAAGFRFASGDVLVTLDADLQNDPADIPRSEES